MSETPIGDQVENEVLPAGMVRGVEPHATSEDVVVMTDPYRIPGEDDPDDPDPETATDQDALAEPTDNSGEPEAEDAPQEADAVQDNANELDGDEPAPDGE